MDSPYQPPKAPVSASPQARRLGHCIAAFVGGAIIAPALVFVLIRNFAELPSGFSSVPLATNATLGGTIAAVAVYRHRRIPLWLATVIGALITFLLSAAPSVWSLWLR